PAPEQPDGGQYLAPRGVGRIHPERTLASILRNVELRTSGFPEQARKRRKVELLRRQPPWRTQAGGQAHFVGWQLEARSMAGRRRATSVGHTNAHDAGVFVCPRGSEGQDELETLLASGERVPSGYPRPRLETKLSAAQLQFRGVVDLEVSQPH